MIHLPDAEVIFNPASYHRSEAHPGPLEGCGLCHDRWITLRRDLASEGAFGASQAGAVLDVSGKWYTPQRAYDQAIGKKVKRSKEAEKRMEIGHRLEPIIADLFREDTGYVVERGQLLLRSKKYPYLLCTPDAFFTADNQIWGVADWKSTGREEGWGSGIPEYVTAQMQQGLLVTGLQVASVGVLFASRGFKYRTYGSIFRDEACFHRLIEEGKAFSECIRKRIPPPVPVQTHQLGQSMLRQELKGINIRLQKQGFEIHCMKQRKEEILELLEGS